ncbi:MAG TPA: pyridoxamine 5'-phosphate oxidase family protein [Dehalococcoidia bacterium]|jgi:general stress protein 26|nr:pyridoxamine 5'-phosphate oxidase family protein [Dehalococcoidia bacterium]
MTRTSIDTKLDPRYSSEGAQPTTWEEASALLESAEIYWLSTVRQDGRPHVTPLIGLWLDGALHFSTGAEERKARNLAFNPQCTVTTGCNAMDQGVDLVLEGEARRVIDRDLLTRVARGYLDKYGPDWKFNVGDGVFHHQEHEPTSDVFVFAIRPHKGFAFARGGMYSQTRWRFG